MKYWMGLARDWGISLVIVFVAFALYQFATAPAPLSEGPAPEFVLPDLHGGEIELADFGESTVVLNFWFTDCGPCRHEIPELAAWSADHPDVPLIGVSTDQLPAEQLRTRAKQLGVTYPVAHDAYGRVARAYNVGLFPTTIVVSKGEIRTVQMGAIDRTMLDELVHAAGG